MTLKQKQLVQNTWEKVLLHGKREDPERPMSADEARGFGPDGNGGVEGQPYTPTGEDQIT